MDATQVLDDFEEEEFNNSGSKKTVAFLKVQAVGEFPETLFPVYEGENIIGRHDNCDITIPLQAVSKKHACIDVHGKNHLICDYNSRNKTRRNQMFLKPQAFYELVHEVELMLADVKCQYLLAQTDVVEKEIVSDSGSETASESMMPQSTEDDEEPEEDLNEEKLTSSAKSEKLKEAITEEYLDQATQDYSYKNPDENSPTFCAETDDDETDDESGDIGSSVNKEETVRCSSEVTASNSTLPNTLEPDTIPETPFTATNEFEPPFKLKRSVDVKIDSSRRISAGNTLAYGLSTLESPNSTRESMNVSESGKESLCGEGSTTEVKNKLLFDDAAEQGSPDEKGKRLPDSMQDVIPDDLLATQLYEPMEIPESPEFLQHDSDCDKVVNESTKITENGAPENEASEDEISQGMKPAGKIPLGKSPEGKNTEGEVSETQTINCKTSGDNISEDNISEDNISEDKTSISEILGGKVVEDTLETQAYGFESLPQDEEVATQAYGLTLDASDTELATQAYGGEDDIEVPKVNNVFKVPGAMNTQELNDYELGNITPRDKNDQKVGERDDEMDIQPTQNYTETQGVKSGETSESSDNFPSFASFMGLESDSDSDFTSKKSSKKKVGPKIVLQSSTPAAVNKSSSIIIEGENALSTEKRCYVECPSVENEISQDEKHEDKPHTRKKSARGRKTSTQSKVKDEALKDTTSTQTKHDEPICPTVIHEDTNEQRETIVVKRGKGRSTRSKKSIATAQNSTGKRNKELTDDIEGDVAKEAEVESLPKARKSTRKRKIAEKNTKTESSEGESSDMKVDVETECKQGELNMSEDEGGDEILKLQISAVDSPETDEFIPKRKAVLEKKRQRGKKGTKELESSNEFENIELVKHPCATAKESVPTKSTRNRKGKKNQEVSEVDSSTTVFGKAEVKGSDGLDKEKDGMVKSSRKGRAKKSENSPGFTGIEDIVKQDNIVESNSAGHTQSVRGSEQELPDAMTPVVNTRRPTRKGATKTVKNSGSNTVEQNLEEKQDKDEQNAIETKIKEAKTPVKGRSKKRKSSENSIENIQQKKETAKKRRKNETAEENLEMKKDETQEEIKFESEERVLTPRSSAKRSSSSSSINLSRSAKKGKKQESEASNNHSSDVKIIFTGLQDSAFIKAKKIVETLGGAVVEHLEDCTHLVTDKVRRTVKLLCAVSRGIPVVDLSWLDASKKSKSFIDSNSFILKDQEAQKKFNFSMEKSLKLAQNAGLLDGYKIHITPHVRPPPNDMKEIIKSAKGQIISKMPTSRDNDVIVLSCDEDTKMCQKANIENVYTAELLLSGILRQEIDLEQHRLVLNATSVVNSSPMTSKGRRKR